MIAGDLPAPLDGLLFCTSAVPFFRDSPMPGHEALWMAVGPRVELTLVARDLAGNESPPRRVTVEHDCSTPGIAIDAGPGGDGAGAAADAARAGGCGCAVGRDAGPAWLVVLAAGALGLTRRRRA